VGTEAESEVVAVAVVAKWAARRVAEEARAVATEATGEASEEMGPRVAAEEKAALEVGLAASIPLRAMCIRQGLV
jgi:CHASE3 domain sensor protein